MDQVEEVKNKTDIVEVISEYVPLKRAGRNFKGLCPIHGEKTPSFMVNPDLQIFKCFGCGAGGDVFSFLEKVEGMEFGEGLQHLAKRAGITLKSWSPSKGEQDKERLIGINALAAKTFNWVLKEHESGKEALSYLKKRGITVESIDKFNLGYAPKGWNFLGNFLSRKKKHDIKDLERLGLVVEGRQYDRFRDRIMFPLANQRGQVVGFAGRVMPGADEKAGGKYVNTPETEIYHKSELLYGYDVTRSEIKLAGWVVVVEGEIDAIASYQAGVKNVVAIKGSALTEGQVELLRRVAESVTLALDADSAGDAASRRGIEIAEKAGLSVKVVRLKSEEMKAKDPGEIAVAFPEVWRREVEQAIPIYDFYLESAVERHGLDVGGKRKIGQELIPIWASIGDQIIKGHYIKKLADTLGVDEEDVRGQLNKSPGSGSGVVTAMEERDIQTRSTREMREGRVVLLAVMGGKVEELEKKELKALVRSEFWKRVVAEIGRGKEVKDLPAELKGKIGELLMTEEEYSEKNWQEAVRLLDLMDVEEKLKDTSDSKLVGELAKKKAELTRDR